MDVHFLEHEPGREQNFLSLHIESLLRKELGSLGHMLLQRPLNTIKLTGKPTSVNLILSSIDQECRLVHFHTNGPSCILVNPPPLLTAHPALFKLLFTALIEPNWCQDLL